MVEMDDEFKWMMGIAKNHYENKGSFLHQVVRKNTPRNLYDKLIMAIYIDVIMYFD